MTREETVELLKEHVKSEQLVRHSYAVEAGMRGYAKHFNEDVELYGRVGILHDIDFEKYKEEHPAKAPELLEGKGFDKDFIDTILSHGLDNEHMRTNILRKTLSGVDQMSSFIVAVALMRPTKLEGLKPKSVKKKMKDKAFAKAVDREYLEKTRGDLGVELDEHINIIVKGLIDEEEMLNKCGDSLFSK